MRGCGRCRRNSRSRWWRSPDHWCLCPPPIGPRIRLCGLAPHPGPPHKGQGEVRKAATFLSLPLVGHDIHTSCCRPSWPGLTRPPTRRRVAGDCRLAGASGPHSHDLCGGPAWVAGSSPAMTGDKKIRESHSPCGEGRGGGDAAPKLSAYAPPPAASLAGGGQAVCGSVDEPPGPYIVRPWQCLNFLPDPQGHGALRGELRQVFMSLGSTESVRLGSAVSRVSPPAIS